MSLEQRDDANGDPPWEATALGRVVAQTERARSAVAESLAQVDALRGVAGETLVALEALGPRREIAGVTEVTLRIRQALAQLKAVDAVLEELTATTCLIGNGPWQGFRAAMTDAE